MSSLKFLNSGVLVGRVENVRQLFVDLLDEARLYRDDQQQIVRMYLTQPHRFALDTITYEDQDQNQDDTKLPKEAGDERDMAEDAKNELDREMKVANGVAEEVVGTALKKTLSKGHVAMTAFKQVRYMAHHFQAQSLTGNLYYTDKDASFRQPIPESANTSSSHNNSFHIPSRNNQSRFSSQNALLIFHGNNKQSNDLYRQQSAYVMETARRFLVSTSLPIPDGRNFSNDNEESTKNALRVREILLRLLWAYHDINAQEMQRLLRDELRPLLASEGTKTLKTEENDTTTRKNIQLFKFAQEFVMFMIDELRTNHELLDVVDLTEEDTGVATFEEFFRGFYDV